MQNKKKSKLEEQYHIDKYGTEKIDLEYDDIFIDVDYGPMDWDTGYGKYNYRGYVDWIYTVDKKEVEEVIADILMDEDEGFAKIEDDDVAYSYVRLNFDELFDKYYDRILDYYRDYAISDAEANIDTDDL